MNVTPRPADMQRFGFPMGGESSVAIDFVDTVYRDTPTTTVDLLAASDTAWWELQASRLANGLRPEHDQVARLRSALRSAFEASIARDLPPDDALDDINSFAELAPISPRLRKVDGALVVETASHPQDTAEANLSAIARDGMAVLLDPERARRLRNCANPTCLMIFVAENSKRIWCSAAGCGNRARAARHYHRHHAVGSSSRATTD